MATKTKLVIPSNIELGYKDDNSANRKWNRDTGKYECIDPMNVRKLGFATYIDAKGKFRKEYSWNNWRQPEMGHDTFENKPMTGFVLGNTKQRSREWFGTGRHVWRVVDPRGFELEITSENLQSLIDHCDIVNAELVGEFVWAWSTGGNMALLPCATDEYKDAKQFTKSVNSKTVSAKDYSPGSIVRTSKDDEVRFIGHFHVIEHTSSYKNSQSHHELRSRRKTLVIKDGVKQFYPAFKAVEVISRYDGDSTEYYNTELRDFKRDVKTHVREGFLKSIYGASGSRPQHIRNIYAVSDKPFKNVTLKMMPAKAVLQEFGLYDHKIDALEVVKNDHYDSTWLSIYHFANGKYMQAHVDGKTKKISHPHSNIAGIKSYGNYVAYIDKRDNGYSHRQNDSIDTSINYVKVLSATGMDDMRIIY